MAAMGSMPVKTDRNDARALAQIVRTGGFRPVPAKGGLCRSWRALLTGRRRVLTKQGLAIVRHAPVGRHPMSAPGVGPLTALALRATIDRPDRCRRSRAVGAPLGLTPRRYPSGKTDRQGGIRRWGDELARTAPYEGAPTLLV